VDDADSVQNVKSVSIDNCNIGSTPHSDGISQSCRIFSSLSLTFFNTGAVDPNAFDPSNPAGTYELDLSDK
jgi:hypothetical protein